MRTLLIDNYDSYTFNLFHLLGEVNGEEPLVVRNDELPWDELVGLAPDNVVISPGPGRPERPRDAGVSLDVLRRADVPVLGVCLGHQELAYASGGTIEHAREVMHGRLSRIRHDTSRLFAGIPQDFLAVRYHSLVVGAVPRDLRVTAWTPDGVIMALEHRERPLFGVQFHPESVSTRHGRALLENFRDLTPRRRTAAKPADAPARRTTARPSGSTELRHRRLEAWCEPEAVFGALYADHDHAVWLDSSRSGAGVARFSFIGAPDGPLGQVVRYDVGARTVVVEHASGRQVRAESVFDHCRRELERLRVDAPELPFDFVGGFAGYFGFELKAECGGRPAHASPLPDAALLLCDRVIAFDHRERRIHLLALAGAGGREDADAWLAATEQRLRALAGEPPPLPPAPAAPGSLRFALRDSAEAYLENIAACRREILEGESYEICLTTELRSEGTLDPVSAYRALRARNPAPFAALLRLGELSVLSSSPERFLRVDRERTVESRPMKGTAARLAEPYRGRLPRGRAATGREDPGREPHDRRPRPQRPRSGLAAGHGGGPAADGRRVARHRPPDGDRGPRPPARGRRRDRLRPRGVSRRLDDGGAEAAHARDHRPSRTAPARRLRRCAGLPRRQRHGRPERRHPHAGRLARTASRSAPAARSSPAPIRRPSWRRCCSRRVRCSRRSAARSKAAVAPASPGR